MVSVPEWHVVEGLSSVYDQLHTSDIVYLLIGEWMYRMSRRITERE